MRQELKLIFSTKRELIVGIDGKRLEVNVYNPELAVEKLVEGQELVLNSNMSVVEAREPRMRGKTAEVANLLSPPNTAKVLAVGKEDGKLRVQ